MRTRKSKPRATEAAPRYMLISRDLRRAIAGGRYPVGAQLPTEHDLCRQFGASRFTIREAIRVLSTAGLVRRKPRAGTVVAALPDDTRYTHGIGSLRDTAKNELVTHVHAVEVSDRKNRLPRTRGNVFRIANDFHSYLLETPCLFEFSRVWSREVNTKADFRQPSGRA